MLHVQHDGWISPRGEAADPGDAATVGNRLFQTSAGSRNVAQKAERVEQVGLPRRVRASNEDPLLQRDIDVREVPPVLQGYVSNEHRSIPDTPPCRGARRMEDDLTRGCTERRQQ